MPKEHPPLAIIIIILVVYVQVYAWAVSTGKSYSFVLDFNVIVHDLTCRITGLIHLTFLISFDGKVFSENKKW